MKKHILLLTTGGTIASSPTGEGLVPTVTGAELAAWLPGLHNSCNVTVRDILQLDSSNIQPEEWQIIARSIFEEKDYYDGIVITHGTDTMAYTASALSFMLPGIEIPVVLTGSQLPIDHPLTDGTENLRTAFAMAASGVRGIYIAFDRKIILGCRSVKTRTTGFDAFESVNRPLIGITNAGGLVMNRDSLPNIAGRCRLQDNLCRDVFLLKLTPGLNPEIFDALLSMHYRGVVIEAFGAGGLHFIRRDLISKLQKMADAGIAVAVCSQCLYERSDLSLYQPGQKALEKGVIQCMDMTTEATVTKLMWALGQTDDLDVVRGLFAQNLSGEISTG